MALSKRARRRIAGVFNARFPELRLDRVHDPRAAQGRRWELPVLLGTSLAGAMAGCRSLQEVEELTADMESGVRSLLGLRRRVPDTTLRDNLVRLRPADLRLCLRRQTLRAHRRKALKPVHFPRGQVAVDGKSVTVRSGAGSYAQRRTTEAGESYGLVRTMTCCLVSARARPCIEAVPIPAGTNEVGHFSVVLNVLDRAYGRTSMIDLISGDAGICSQNNARLVTERGYDYLFGLKEDTPELLAQARLYLGDLEDPVAVTEDREGDDIVLRRLYLTGDLAGYLGWDHLETVLRVEKLWVDEETGEIRKEENRYFVASPEPGAFEPKEWLAAVRNHWGVENHCHQRWDTTFAEDDRPWITANPRGTLVACLLRRIAYNMLALFRSVTQRSERKRRMSWRRLMDRFYITIVRTLVDELDGLRPRSAAVPS